MPVQTYGTSLGNGFAGGYAANGLEEIEGRRIVTPSDPAGINFGDAVVLVAATSPSGQQTVSSVASFLAAGGTLTGAKFAGVAVRELRGPLNFLNQNTVQYPQAGNLPYMKLGKVSVVTNVGSPVDGGTVFVRVAANAAIPAGIVGGFEAAADGTNTVALTNCQWRSGADSNGVAMLSIFTAQQA